MEEIFNNITMFYKTLEWLNMRENSHKKMILGKSKLDYKPFMVKINNTGINNVLQNISKSVKLINIDRNL